METKKFIVILGPPGSGKGTQAKFLAENFGYFYFGTGSLMRQEAQKGTELGQKFQAVWDRGKGELVSEDLVEGLVNRKLQEIDLSRGVIFDGYPRTIKQAENLNQILKISPKDIIVLNIEVPSEDLMKRMQTRKVCQECGKIFSSRDENRRTCDVCQGELAQRQEDQPETVKKRLDVYEEQTKPLIDYYQETGGLINIDGKPSIEAVKQEITDKLSGILR